MAGVERCPTSAPPLPATSTPSVFYFFIFIFFFGNKTSKSQTPPKKGHEHLNFFISLPQHEINRTREISAFTFSYVGFANWGLSLISIRLKASMVLLMEAKTRRWVMSVGTTPKKKKKRHGST